MEVMYHVDTETPLIVYLPPFIVYEVTYTEPGVRGDTSSTNSLKQATNRYWCNNYGSVIC